MFFIREHKRSIFTTRGYDNRDYTASGVHSLKYSSILLAKQTISDGNISRFFYKIIHTFIYGVDSNK
jgi:hypothetical protein